MTPEQLAAIIGDARLTPDATRVILYVATLGPAGIERDVKGEDLSILLHGGEKPIRAAIARAVHCGYLEARFGGRAGHKLTVVFTEMAPPREGIPERIPPLEESISPNHSLGGVNSDPVGGGYMGGAAPPAPAAPDARARNGVENSRPAPPGARTSPPSPAELEPLRAHLGEFAYAVDVFASSADHAGTWPTAVMRFGPNGTRRDFWQGVPPEREPAILADALLNFASDFPGEAYRAPLFESILTRARDGAPPRKPPKIIPGTEHAAVRSNGTHAEEPGRSRFLRREGATPVPERVAINLRRTAEQKAGDRAPPEEVERIFDELVTEYDRHHGAGAAR